MTLGHITVRITVSLIYVVEAAVLNVSGTINVRYWIKSNNDTDLRPPAAWLWSRDRFVQPDEEGFQNADSTHQ